MRECEGMGGIREAAKVAKSQSKIIEVSLMVTAEALSYFCLKIVFEFSVLVN